MPDLNAVAAALKAQAQKGTVVLDGTIFAADMLQQIGTAFALPAGANLTISGVDANEIPAAPGGSFTTTKGTAAVLGQTGVKIGLTFQAAGNSVTAVIAAAMSDAWTFTDSFAGLDKFPFQDLKTTVAHFVFATAPQTAFPWPGKPSDTVALAAGLNFLSEATFNNFSPITSLLGAAIGTTSFKFYGPFAPTAGQSLPVGKIRAEIGSGSFGIGVAPNALTLSDPAVAVQIGTSNDANPIQDIDLVVEADFNKTLQVAVAIPTSGGNLGLSTTPLPYQSSIDKLIESLPGGSGFRSYIPSELTAIFKNVGLDNFSMVVDPSPQVTYLNLSISTLAPWNVIPNVLQLDAMNLRIETLDPTGLDLTRIFIEAKADFLTAIFHDQFDFTLELEKQRSWQLAQMSGSYFGAVNLGDIVAGLIGKADSVPQTLRNISFSDFGATVTSDGQSYTYGFSGSIETSFPILETQLSAALNFAATKTPAGYSIVLGGAVVIGEDAAFVIELDLTDKDASLSAMWQSTGTPLEFADIASALGWSDMPAVPAGLDLGLTSAGFSYDFTKRTLVLTASSKNYGRLLFVTDPAGGNRVYLFGLDITLGGSLSQIPLIGDKLPASADLTLQEIQVLIASSAIKSDTVKTYNTWITKLDAALPADEKWTLTEQDLAAGPSLTINLLAGGEPHSLVLSVPPGDQEASASPQSQPAKPAALASPQATGAASGGTAAGSDQTIWLNLQKSLGPLFFNRVGISYANGNVDFLLDASMKISALTLGLIGVGVGSPISSFEPHFRIDGLAVDYESGPVVLSGGLIALRGSDGSVSEYDGAVTLKAEEFELAALAAYSTGTNKSMFAFAVLEAPIGGPPFLFVTGVAAGFGYNRALRIPSAADMPKFPLVQAVMGQSPFKGNDPGGAVAILHDYIPEQDGENWVALGLRFTTFELLKSFALVTCEFGPELEFDLIGMSALSIPNEAASPIAYAELGLVGSFKVSEGSVAISGQLTPASFVLDRDCHLTGGFAFYFWGSDSPSGASAGDFVVTLGGYHPAFKKPDWYPVEPLLGANWQVSSELVVKGGYYFALTPTTVMAGGELEAVWQSGDLKAWFTAHADFLLCWKPFHYEADIGISLGASYKVDLLVTSVTVTVHVGVEVDFWGPSFAGRATVDLYVCTLTIKFGDSDPKKDPIPWSEFKTSFLPPPRAATPALQAVRTLAASAVGIHLTAAAPPLPAADPYCLTRASAGVVKDLSNDKKVATDIDWVVNSELLELVTVSVIPCTDHILPAGVTVSGNMSWNKSFGVGPVGIGDGELQSTHTVALIGIDKAGETFPFEATPVLKNVPKATWSKAVALSPGIAAANQQPATIGGVLTGFALRPTPDSPDTTPAIGLGPLQFTQDPHVKPFLWAAPQIAQSDTFNQSQAMSEFKASLKDANVASTRAALIAALTAQKVFDVAPPVDVSAMAANAATVLLSPPVLSLLGEQPTANAA